MKGMKKIIVLMMLIAILMQNAISIAGVIEVGDRSKIQRGDLGFYSIQYWNEARSQWMYITYSQTFYIDKQNNKRIAYCVNSELDGVGWLPGEVSEYDVNISQRLNNLYLWRVYKNGYPYVSPSELGVETTDDAYLATKQAAYFIIKNKSLAEVYSYFRAGETEINGQNLEEIQRRGKKVVDAIYKLVDKAYNGSDTIIHPNIDLIGKFQQEESNEKYYSQVHKIKKDDYNQITYKFTDIIGAPEGTFVTDIEGNKKDTFYDGEYLKVMVPKEKIDKTYNISVYFEMTCDMYPVYYADSGNSSTQNYVVIAEKNDTTKGYISTTAIGNKSVLKIKKVDVDTQEPIQGVTFDVKYANGSKIGTFSTDQNGEIKIEKLFQGTIILTEQKTGSEYILNSETTEVEMGYDDSIEVEIENEHKKGSLEILKTDRDDNSIVLEGVEFQLIDEKSNVVANAVTDKNGYAQIDNINIGKYTLKETKAKENYKTAEDQEITISWNEVLSLKIQNEKKKGNIIIYKVDKDNNEKVLSGVELELSNDTREKIADIVTDENGKAEIDDLPIGEYFIREIKTNPEYVLLDTDVITEVKEDETSEITIENEKIKGKIQIVKKSADENKITHAEAGSTISGVKFGVYNEEENLIQELITNENGIAITDKLVIGKYTIKELETSQWYLLNNDEFQVEIKENGKVEEIEVTNESKNPKVEIIKSGPNIVNANQEIRYDFEIKNTGNVSLKDFTWYDFLPYDNSKITKISTGTYNQEITYSIYFKTNKKTAYLVLAKDLNSLKNNYIDVNNVYLEEDEIITEIKVCFGDVDIGFLQIEKPCMYMKINGDVENNIELINETIIEGKHQNYKVCNDDTVKTIVQNVAVEKKKLPRTGY